MAVLTKDQILSSDDLEMELVDVPEWGGEVWVRTLRARERDQFEAESLQKKGENYETNFRNLRARLVALTMVDEEGNLLFKGKDVEALGNKSARAMDRVFSVAQRLNGIGKHDIEELTKNSEPAPSESSS